MLDSRVFFLVPQDSRHKGIAWKLLAGATITIGREAHCDIVLDDAAVSKTHVRLDFASDGVRVRDVGSGNGTFIDERRISSAAWPPGSVLRLGAIKLALASAADHEAIEKVSEATRQGFILEWSRRGDESRLFHTNM